MQEILTESLQTVPGLELAGVAETATEALAAFESHRPDVVILDSSCGWAAGWTCCTRSNSARQRAGCWFSPAMTRNPFARVVWPREPTTFFSKNRQHRELIQELHNLGGDAPAATGRPADAGPSDSADFSHL